MPQVPRWTVFETRLASKREYRNPLWDAVVTAEFTSPSGKKRTVEAFWDAVARTRARGLDICVHVILGLPGEDKMDMLETARTLGEMDIQAVKIHLLYVIRDTPLHRLYEQGTYACLSREAYVDIVCDFLALLPPHVIIHRLTGDPHRDELVAPLWVLEKQVNLERIRETLQDRRIWQGKACPG